jgi:hypothetical protein
VSPVPVPNAFAVPFCLGLVSKSSPKKPRGRNIFKALFCCFRSQHVGQSSSSTELTAYKEEANTIAKVAGWGGAILAGKGLLAWDSLQTTASRHCDLV